MPIYTFRCAKCSNEFDIILNRGDPPPEKCPRCDGVVEKQFPTGVNHKFKCMGFHKTDYTNRERQQRNNKG